jgi:hypothetical protein
MFSTWSRKIDATAFNECFDNARLDPEISIFRYRSKSLERFPHIELGNGNSNNIAFGTVIRLRTGRQTKLECTVPDSFHNTNSINGFRGMFGLNKAII